MTLPASGAISFSNIDTELGLSATAQIGLNCSTVRSLFGISSGAIDMNTGHGKSNILAFAGFSYPAPINNMDHRCGSVGFTPTGIAVNPNGNFVSVGQGGNYSYSANGCSWTAPTSISGTLCDVRVAANSANYFVMVGTCTSNYVPKYSTSSNGTTWSSPAAMGGTSCKMFVNAVTANSTGYMVAVGQNGNSPYCVKFTHSIDGTTWSGPATALSCRGQIKAVTVNPCGKFVGVGYKCGSNNPIYIQGNGASMSGGNISSGSYLMQSVTWSCSASKFVALGITVCNYPVYSTSTNGSSWSTPSVFCSTNKIIFTSIAYHPSGTIIAVGNEPSPHYYQWYTTSTNGTSWTGPTKISCTYARVDQGPNLAISKKGLAVVSSARCEYPTQFGIFSQSISSTAKSSAVYEISGSYSWVAPSCVSSVSVVVVGGGGVCGGSLAWKNNISVNPGCSYTVVVGSPGSGQYTAGGNSYFINASTVFATGGGSLGARRTANFVGDGGGKGGYGNNGGGGAGGYAGAGGLCGSTSGTAGAGGAGGGGWGQYNAGSGGGGVGIYGQGSNGAGGTNAGGGSFTPGHGGSGGQIGTSGYSSSCCGASYGGKGGKYGGGGGFGASSTSGSGGTGVVRIVYPGTSRQFPSTCVGTP